LPNVISKPFTKEGLSQKSHNKQSNQTQNPPKPREFMNFTLC